jgi:hypothetical protein
MRKEKHCKLALRIKGKKIAKFSNLYKTLGRICMLIGVVLMPVRIRGRHQARDNRRHQDLTMAVPREDTREY